MKSLGKLIMVSLTGVLLSSQVSLAQFEPMNGYYAEALLFSQTQGNGSARIQGIGGAQTALGGDVSSISGNPAGLGFYNHSEISFSPSLNFMTANSSYLGNANTSSIANFNIGNVSLVINKNKQTKGGTGFLGGSFGFSYNRINDFHYQAFYSGYNNTNDFIDYVLNQVANNNYTIDQNNYIQELSFQNYLINDFNLSAAGDTLSGISSFVESPTQHAPLQSEKISTAGSQDQWSFSYGADISDRFYIGASLGIVSLDYRTTREYKEVRYPQSILDNYVLNESLHINGSGVNGTFGAIVRPIDFLTVGVSYTTPAIYQINDEFNANMSSTWRNTALAYYPNDSYFTGNQSDAINPIVSKYNLRTAGHLNAGLAYFFNKNGFITGDVEWTDYTQGRLSGGSLDFQTDNNNISQLYKPAVNYKVGGEYRIADYRIRLGYNHTGDPYNNVDNLNGSKNAFSGGVGYRSKSFYTDLAGIYSMYKNLTSPYDIATNKPVANFNNSKLSFVLSMGFLF